MYDMNCICFPTTKARISGFLEIFQKSPSGPSKPSDDSC